MPYARASYPGGGYQTEVSGSPGMGVDGSPFGDMGWIQELARRRASQQLRAGEIQNRQNQWGFEEQQKLAQEARNSRSKASREAMRGDPVEEHEMLARIAAARAQYGTSMSGGMPTRTVSGAGIIPGQTPDALKMSGAQRAVFLPQSAGGGSLFGESAGTRGNLTRAGAEGQQAADMAGIDEMAAQMAGGRPGFGISQPGPMRAPGGTNSQGWATFSPQEELQRNQARRQDRSPSRLFNPQYGQSG